MPGAQGSKTVKGAQSDSNYVSRLLLDCVPVFHKIIIRYDTRCYVNVRSKADISQLNLPHETDNLKSVKTEKTKK